MKNKTITIKSIIESEFINADIHEITNKLKQHQLYDFINSCLEQINLHIKQKNLSHNRKGILNVAPIGVMMLVKFNEYFRELSKNGEITEKEKLEYLLGNIMKRLLIQVVKVVPKNEKQAQLKHIVSGLTDACKLYQYDFEKLSEFLNTDDMVLELYASLESSESISSSNNSELPGLILKHDSTEALNLLCTIFKKEQITEEVDKIKLLFENPTENLAITFNENKKVHTLQFLAVLKNSGLISYHHCGGFYQVFSCHVKNFDLNFLNGKTPQKRIDAVRKLKGWFAQEEYFENQLRQIIDLRHSA